MMVSQEERKRIRRFVCGQLRDETDLRYSLSIQWQFKQTINV